MELSPMMKHYLSVKDRYKDCVIFYRLGDFYEMFFEDAVRVSEMLGLTLTGRDCGLEERAPMCGVPFHAAEGYIAKLVALGEKVAICEQLSAPATSKGMVDRDVIRVVTAGTLTADASLDEKANNYICAVCKDGENCAIAWADITTGELSASQFSGTNAVKNIIIQLVKLGVKEIISNDEMLFSCKDFPEVTRGVLPKFSSYLGWTFTYQNAERTLCSQLNVKTLSAFGLDDKKLSVCALGALIEYLKETQKHALANIDTVRYVSPNSCMQLDGTAIRNLEIVKSLNEGKRYGSLLWLLDKTSTAMGARLLSNLIVAPLYSIERINYRLDGVEELFNSTVVRVGLEELLKQVKDVERLTGKISNNCLMPNDCLALAKSLLVVPNIKFRLAGFKSQVLNDISCGLCDLTDIANTVISAITENNTPNSLKDGGYIREGFDSRLDELREIKNGAKDILAQLEMREKDATGIRTLKIGYNRVFGYFIEVSKSFKDKVPISYQRRQTLANAERYVTEELKEIENRILSSEETALKLEAQIYADLLNKLVGNINKLKTIADSIARLDVLCSFAEVSKNNKYVRPSIVSSDAQMIIKDGRHPVVEQITKEKFVPNDTLTDVGENRTLIITGPNMAGKSTYMRQNA
ncbi:MAG: DNA mismatch repair protein MutS, partial [Clostridia bacterium]|nr:DNA mismatch repair protein MutS [Clostridia bacterium]